MCFWVLCQISVHSCRWKASEIGKKISHSSTDFLSPYRCPCKLCVLPWVGLQHRHSLTWQQSWTGGNCHCRQPLHPLPPAVWSCHFLYDNVCVCLTFQWANLETESSLKIQSRRKRKQWVPFNEHCNCSRGQKDSEERLHGCSRGSWLQRWLFF